MLRPLRESFEARFGRPPSHAARAPGRINLIGEHTDYSGGLVLPLAVDRDTLVLAAARRDARFRVFSRERDEVVEFDLGAARLQGGWIDYVQGVASVLRDRDPRATGFDLALASEVAPGSGLSSSAALCVGVATVLDAAAGLGLTPAERAAIAHRAEAEFVGVGCGVMDPMASALGRRDCALRIDCRSLAWQPVPLPAARLRLLVADSGVRHRLAPESGSGARSGSGAESGYAERRAQCEQAVVEAHAARVGPADARSLRDFGPADLPALEGALSPRVFRRARHVVRENARVEAACQALAEGDLARLGALLCEGMASLRDDFEVSVPELDALCEIAEGMPGVYGSRLTGAGFGGCSLHLVAPDAVETLSLALRRGFEQRFGAVPRVFEVAASDGASVLPL